MESLLKNLCDQHKLKITYKLSRSDTEGKHYKIKLFKELSGGRVKKFGEEINYHQGSAILTNPSIYDVVYSLIIDSSFYEDFVNLSDFVNEVGYTNIEKAIEDYESCKRTNFYLKLFFGKNYEEFMIATYEG